MKIEIILIISIASTAFCMNHFQKSLNFPDFSPELKALNDVVDVFYDKNLPIDILYNNDGALESTIWIQDKFIAKTNGKYAFKIRTQESMGIIYERSTIIFLYSCPSITYANFNHILQNSKLKFLIYVENCEFNDIKNNIYKVGYRKLTYQEGSLAEYEYILINNQNNLYLISIEYFTKYACNQPQLMILNIFIKSTQKWTKMLKNHKKFSNFYGCKLYMLVNRNPDTKNKWIYTKKINNKLQPISFIPNLFEDIGKIFNYNPKYLLTDEFYEEFNCFLNAYKGNKIGTDANVCFIINRIFPDYKFNKFSYIHHSIPFMNIHDIVLVTPGDPYTSYEKLLLPFDKITWILLTFTFLIAFSIVAIINFFPRKFQDILYGHNVKFPALNIISTFYGLSQPIVPKSNFSRFILLNFVLFCLIFRTCYQSKLFEFITSTIRHPPPNSLKEMADRNYRLLARNHNVDYNEMMKNSDLYWPELEFISSDDIYNIYLTQSQNTSAKLGLFYQQYLTFLKNDMKLNLINWHQIPELFSMTFALFNFYNNNFYLFIINEVLKAWTDTGIMDKILNNFIGEKWKFESVKLPKVFKFEDLKFGFFIWLGCCGISFIFLIAEFFYFFAIIIIYKINRRLISNAKIYPIIDLNEKLQKLGKNHFLVKKNLTEIKEHQQQ